MAEVGDNIPCYKCNQPTVITTKKEGRYNACPACLTDIEGR
jgi:DNA-directed RNA polymerase subunit RPC12/RpoP